MLAEVINLDSEYYGCEIELLERVDLGILGIWYSTIDLLNEYTECYIMWFKEGELDIYEDLDDEDHILP